MLKLSNPLFFACALGGLFACGGPEAPARAPSEAASTNAASDAPPDDGAPPRPTLTAQACEASGGSVVGDIGDGAIHRPEYRCPNGAKPTGSIGAAEGGPMAIEGSVCCPR